MDPSTLPLESSSAWSTASETKEAYAIPGAYEPDVYEGEAACPQLSESPFHQQTTILTDTQTSTPVLDSDITLSPAQSEVLEKVRRGESVFFTGSAGTGKSVLLREIIKELGGRVSAPLAITASTGIAAVNIGGTTLHSFAGIGLGKEPVEKLAVKILVQKSLRSVLERWQNVETLIIDEISMIDGVLFDKLEHLARIFRQNTAPFGGIQLVLSGDFCQLPPVPDRHDGIQVPVTFAFEAESWKSCIGRPVILTKVFRQKDQRFIDMLNAMRFGRLDDSMAAEFARLDRPVRYDDGIAPTELFPLRQDVDEANNARLARLPGVPHLYIASDKPGIGVKISQSKAEQLLDRLVAAKEVTLKVGAQVMLIKNLIQGHLVNGSVGQVIDFRTPAVAKATNTEISQVDNSKRPSLSAFEDRSVDKDLFIRNRVWPVVRFTNGREILCVPALFSVVSVRGVEEAVRDQIPLILAWALSVHKSQGQTLERVKVDLGRTFEKGQAYVALSRATKMDTLQILNFDKHKVMAHPRVLSWHERIDSWPETEDDILIDDEMDNEEAMAAYHADLY